MRNCIKSLAHSQARVLAHPGPLSLCLLAACACLAMLGCSSPNVNPSTARANTGYVDFYTDTNLDLSWEIKQARQPGGEMETLFYDITPVPENILRLAVPPGNHTFRIWLVNRVTDPQTITTSVENGRVTPIHVALEPTGTASVQNKEYGFHPSAKGYGRGTKIVVTDSQVYRINATAGSPLTYQTKERMTYFASQPKP